MAIADTLRLYREGITGALHDDTRLDGIIREICLDVHTSEVLDWDSLADYGSSAYLLDIRAYPGLVHRIEANYVFVTINERNQIGWAGAVVLDQAREWYDQHTVGWNDDDYADDEPDHDLVVDGISSEQPAEMFEVVGWLVSDELVPVDGVSSSEFIREQMLLRQANETAEREYEQRDPE